MLGNHPRWSALKKLLKDGAEFKLKSIPEEIRIQDLKASFKRGNHKSALKNKEFLAKAMEKEIKKGWILPLPEDKYLDIPELILSPMGVADHLGITASGEFAPKKRVTHDLSFPGVSSKESVNSRIDDDELEPIMFGFALLRIIHYIVSLRSQFPKKKILIRKDDWKSAYRRTHLNAKSCLSSAVRVKIREIWLILISLRLPFGGSPCPNFFCLITDIITDTINDLLQCKDWDHKTVKSDFVNFIPEMSSVDDSVPFAQSRDLSVDIPIETCGKSDVFIDDVISVCVDLDDNVERLTAAPCTVIHAVSHKATNTFDVERDDMLEIDKTNAEGAPSEEKICLGLLLDTRRLLVKLPFHKAVAWTSQINSVLSSKSVGSKKLQSVMGRLENIAMIIPMLGHFLNNIRNLCLIAEERDHNVRINDRVRKDLDLSIHFIKKAQEGISMNLITFRKPTIVYVGDASEHGL